MHHFMGYGGKKQLIKRVGRVNEIKMGKNN